MKTKILSLAMMFVVTLGLTKSTYAATADYTILTNVKAINKIEVHGNVELFISDNTTEQLKVYNKYYAESALVQSSNGVLRISSYNAEKLVVWISSDNLRSVSAYDNAEVRSFGNISKIEFNVELHDNATANLNLDVYSAVVTLKDNAKIELRGVAQEYTLNHNFNTTITDNNFSARYAIDQIIATPVVAKNDEIIGLE